MGRLLKVGTCRYGSTPIVVTEARAMRDGIFMTLQAGFRHIIVEGDNQMVIQEPQGSEGPLAYSTNH